MKPYFERDGITIYHGDCREILPHITTLGGIVTDPPYGINYVHGRWAATEFSNVKIFGDDEPFDPSHLLKYEHLILWGGNNYADKLPGSRGWLIWDKRCGTVVNDHGDAEIAWSNLSNTIRIYYHMWDGFRRGAETGTKRVHATQKPIALMQWCIEFVPDDLIIDPYCGSGSTLRAAKNLGRKAVGIEIEEKYCEIAAKRMSQEVLNFGKDVTHEIPEKTAQS